MKSTSARSMRQSNTLNARFERFLLLQATPNRA